MSQTFSRLPLALFTAALAFAQSAQPGISTRLIRSGPVCPPASSRWGTTTVSDPHHPSDEVPRHTVSVTLAHRHIPCHQYPVPAVPQLGVFPGAARGPERIGYAGRQPLYLDTYQALGYNSIGWNGALSLWLTSALTLPESHGSARQHTCNWRASNRDWTLSTTSHGRPISPRTVTVCHRSGMGVCRARRPVQSLLSTLGATTRIYQGQLAGINSPVRSGPYPWTTPVGFYNGQLHAKAISDGPAARTDLSDRRRIQWLWPLRHVWRQLELAQ